MTHPKPSEMAAAEFPEGQYRLETRSTCAAGIRLERARLAAWLRGWAEVNPTLDPIKLADDLDPEPST